MSYFLDTNTLIFFFKGIGKIAERLWLKAPEEVGIPAVVLYELETGIAKSSSPEKRAGQLRELLAAVSIAPFGRDEAGEAARIRAFLESAGTPIGPMDTLIAGTAHAHAAILVAHNTKEFSRIPGLKLEDWFL